MPLFLVERTFCLEAGPRVPGTQDLLEFNLEINANPSRAGVIWIHSYITPDNMKSFCLYEAPTPDSVRRAVGLNGLPIDRINEVRKENSQ